MGTFIKTFMICLVMAFGFLLYKFFELEGHNPDLIITKNNPIFSTQKTNKFEKTHTEDFSEKVDAEKNNNFFEDINNQPESIQEANDKLKKEEVKVKPVLYKHVCYFYNTNGLLTPITRELKTKNELENTITVLLKGPTISESKRGFYSEIPANVDLINVKRKDNSIIVNLSSNFGNGGGSQSIINRVNQLTKTVKNIEPKKNIYLYINGKEVEYLGGDGVYIKQPLN